MIARIWHGWAASFENADADEDFLRTSFLPAARRLAGYRGADVLRRSIGDEIEFVTITRFESLDAVRAFAGEDFERANVAPRARELLARFDAHCSHFEIAFTSEGA